MTKSSLLPLAILYTEGSQRVEGATRFQKLVFLAQEETDLEEYYSYHAEKYGPFSYDLAKALDTFMARGLVQKHTVENSAGNEKYVYSLTPKGTKFAKKMLDKEKFKGLFDPAAEIKRRYNEEPLNHLLQYVYNKYPGYTTETELDLDRLFDPEAESQFLEPDTGEPDFAGAGPEEGLKANYSAEDVF